MRLVGLPWAADRCPCVEKLRAVAVTVGIRDGAVQLVLTHHPRVRTCVAFASVNGTVPSAFMAAGGSGCATESSSCSPRSSSTRTLSSAPPYCVEQDANREIRVWHFVIENGY
jgi:hypothetical protein